MNIVGARIKKTEQFGYYQMDQRRYRIKVRLSNMTKEQAEKVEKAIRKAIDSILPVKREERK